MARLLVKSVFAFNNRSLIAIIGNIIDGEIEAGMFLFSADDDQRFQIKSIEAVRSDDHNDIGFLIKSDNSEELSYLKGIENKIVRVGL